MNIFIDQFEELCSTKVLTQEMESELLDHILSNSSYTNHTDFAEEHIPYDSAESIVLANDYFLPDYLAKVGIDSNIITDAISEHPEHLASHLAFHAPHIGTQLLDELLYYRSKNRI